MPPIESNLSTHASRRNCGATEPKYEVASQEVAKHVTDWFEYCNKKEVLKLLDNFIRKGEDKSFLAYRRLREYAGEGYKGNFSQDVADGGQVLVQTIRYRGNDCISRQYNIASLPVRAAATEETGASVSQKNIADVIAEFNGGKPFLVSVQNESGNAQRINGVILDLHSFQNSNSIRRDNFNLHSLSDMTISHNKCNLSGSVLCRKSKANLYSPVGTLNTHPQAMVSILPKFLQSQGIDREGAYYESLEHYKNLILNNTGLYYRNNTWPLELQPIIDFASKEKHLLAGLTAAIIFNVEDVSIQNAFTTAGLTENRKFSAFVGSGNNAYSALVSGDICDPVFRDKKFKLSEGGTSLDSRENNQETLGSLLKHVTKHRSGEFEPLTELLFLVERQDVRDGISAIAVDLSSGGFAPMNKGEVGQYLIANQDLFQILKKDIGDLPCVALYYDKESGGERQLVKIEWNEQGAFVSE
ncbi:hypothetical protein ACPUER_35870 [Burkholderia sp. DN3021]|uniref:hypothetical protein n=1 Tax=Burkholderia sp. DN3021 TaxID=3410137 RepID=UPI003C7CC9D6